MTSIHGECFDNGQAGRCGIDTCSMFIRGECHIYQEVVENSGKLSWDNVQEVLNIHNDGFGDYNMKKISDEIVQILTEANEKVILLSKMNEVPWASLKKDTLLIVADDLDKLHRGLVRKSYFAEFHQDKIYVYRNGTTSQTHDRSQGPVKVDYALPIDGEYND